MIKILRFIDTYIFGGFILLFFWIRFFSSPTLRTPKKILVIRLWALWSSLLTYPMITELRNYFSKETHIHLLASKRNKNIYTHQEVFDEIFDIFSWKGIWHIIKNFRTYDIVIDAEDYFHLSTLVSLWTGKKTIGYGNLLIRKLGYTHPVIYNDQQHAALTFLDLLSPIQIPYNTPNLLGKFKYQNQSLEVVDEIFHEAWLYICLHTGWAETAPERFWSKKNWAILIQQIQTHIPHVHIVLTGTKFEESSIQDLLEQLPKSSQSLIINTCCQLNLNQLAYLLEKVNLTISNDTGVMHLSASMNTPTIWLFWPNLPNRFWPYPPKYHTALYKGNGTPYINVHLRQFLKDTHRSIDNIHVDDVWDAIQAMLNIPQIDTHIEQRQMQENH